MVRAAVYRVDLGTVPPERPMPHLWDRRHEARHPSDLRRGNPPMPSLRPRLGTEWATLGQVRIAGLAATLGANAARNAGLAAAIPNAFLVAAIVSALAVIASLARGRATISGFRPIRSDSQPATSGIGTPRIIAHLS
jgi:hypothetical protein